jgi:hypothetical protein
MNWQPLGFVHSAGQVLVSYQLKDFNMYQIVKQEIGTKRNTLMLDSQAEVLEYDNLCDAKDMCDILNANAKGFNYKVKEISKVRHKDPEPDDLASSVKAIQFYLENAAGQGLQAEVVAFALKYMKEDNSLKINEAMSLGFHEWMK